MNQEKLSRFYKFIVIAVGGLVLSWMFFNLPKSIFSWDFAFAAIFTVTITPRMSIVLPRSKIILSFSDSVIFLTFIFYGAAAATLLAATEVLANCFYLRKKGIRFSRLMILFNAAVAVIATAAGFLAWQAFLDFSHTEIKLTVTRDLLAALSFLALAQFSVEDNEREQFLECVEA